MPLYAKSASMHIAVTCFFMIAFIGWFTGLDPLTCCKRAVMGAVAAYLITRILVNIINNILISAFVKARIEEQKKEMNGRGQ